MLRTVHGVLPACAMRARSRLAPLVSFAACAFACAAVAACGTSALTAQGGGGTTGEGDGGSLPEDDAAASGPDAATALDASGGDASKSAKCASSFGTALTAGFGRADGVVLAVLTPADQQCPRPNRDHVIVQITMAGKAYRMVVNVQSDFGPDLRVRLAQLNAPLPAPAWSEGWHTGVALDYPTSLNVHNASFVPYEMNALVARIADAVTIGDRVSFYTWTSGGDSAHKVHRNPDPSADGAIVMGAGGPSPTWLLFHFDGQTF